MYIHEGGKLLKSLASALQTISAGTRTHLRTGHGGWPPEASSLPGQLLVGDDIGLGG